MNVLAKHHLKYAKEWFTLSIAGNESVDAAFCEHHMWECLLNWAVCKDLE